MTMTKTTPKTPSNRSRALLWIPALAAALAAACSGGNGAPGKDGTSCTLTDNQNGTATIRCADGTSFTVTSGKDGTNGSRRHERHATAPTARRARW